MLSVAALGACQRQAEPIPPRPAGQYSDAAAGYDVSLDQATAVAENIAYSPEVQTQRAHNQATGDTQRVFTGSQKVRSIRPVLAPDGKPAMYFCEYQPGGFAVVAADQHITPILAFGAYGRLPTDQEMEDGNLPDGLITWLETTRQLVAALRQYPGKENTDPDAASQWAARLMPNPPTTPTVPQCDGSNATMTEVLQLTPSWGQDAPYHDELLFPRFNGKYCKTGCVATAMGEIMAHWQQPASYQWSQMPPSLTYQGPQTEVARLCHNLGDAVTMDYGVQESSARSSRIPRAFATIGYSSATYHDYPDGSYASNVATVSTSARYWYDIVDNLNNGQPVILGGYDDQYNVGLYKWGSGNGHAWVCDGYLRYTDNCYSYVRFRLNWGWRGEFNGWFAFNNWAVYNNGQLYRNYKYCQDIVLDIHP